MAGWAEIQNGELMAVAESHGYEVLVTGDKNLEYQQRVVGRKLAIVLLSAVNWPVIQPHVALIRTALDNAFLAAFRKSNAAIFEVRGEEKGLRLINKNNGLSSLLDRMSAISMSALR